MRKNIFAHIPELLMDFPIGIPQNAKAETLQKGVPLSVLREHFRFKMLRTVKLNDKLGVGAIEVHNIGTQNLLSVYGHRQLFQKIAQCQKYKKFRLIKVLIKVAVW